MVSLDKPRTQRKMSFGLSGGWREALGEAIGWDVFAQVRVGGDPFFQGLIQKPSSTRG